MIAHELRSPLTAIRWIFEELNKDSLTADERKELIRLGSLAVAKLSKVVDGIGADFKSGDINFSELVAKVTEECEPIAKQYGVGLHIDCPQEAVVVRGNSAELDTALSNLVINAIKYNKKNGSVTVRLRNLISKNMAEVSISDTGVGMSLKEKGLGLSIVEKIIKKYKGRVWVDSILGKGSKFHFVLPTKAK